MFRTSLCINVRSRELVVRTVPDPLPEIGRLNMNLFVRGCADS